MANISTKPLLVGEFSVEVAMAGPGAFFLQAHDSGESSGLSVVSIESYDSTGTPYPALRCYEDNVFMFKGSTLQQASDSFDFGTIGADAEIPVMFWNSSSHLVQLDSVNSVGDGSEAVEFVPAIAPHLFKPGECLNSVLRVASEGSSPSVNAILILDFAEASNVNDLTLAVKALRLALFNFIPDFAEPASITWSTDTNIIRKQDGSEQRINIQKDFAKEFAFKFTTLNRKESVRLKAFLHQFGGKMFGAPYWIDAQPVSASAGDSVFSIVPGFCDFTPFSLFAIIDKKGGDFELLSIQETSSDSITSSQQCARNHPDAMLVPVHLAVFSEDSLQIDEFTSENISTTLSFDTFVN